MPRGKQRVTRPRMSLRQPGLKSSSLRPPMLSVFRGRDCVGFLLSRGPKGFEAFDGDQYSIGLFADQHCRGGGCDSYKET